MVASLEEMDNGRLIEVKRYKSPHRDLIIGHLELMAF